MTTSIHTRQATVEDLGDLAVLFDQYRMFYGRPSDLEGARAFLLERFIHLESVLFISRDEATGEAAGFTQLYPTFSSISMKRVWILNDLYVAPAYRNRQVGLNLLEAAKSFAKQTKAKGLELSTHIHNERAQKLYELNGYVREEDYYHYSFQFPAEVE